MNWFQVFGSLTQFLVLLVCTLPVGRANLMSLFPVLGSGLNVPVVDPDDPHHEHNLMCQHFPGLVMEQQKLCQSNPGAMPCVGLGARVGLRECQQQFAYERWNCSVLLTDGAEDKGVAKEGDKGEITPLLEKGTKETAFVYAITSAGVVHAITRSCSAGNLTDCSCDTRRQGQTARDGWKWGGCSDNVDYGVWFAQTFIDAPERIKAQNERKNVRPLMNQYNNEVGRRVIETNMQLKCRCHGVSGSCGIKTCWNIMPKFKDIGKMLKHKYESSVQLDRNKRKELRKARKRSRRKAGDMELIYVADSPDFCKPNPRKGIYGTQGRACIENSNGRESCDKLCCGRGYNTVIERRSDRCRCKFIWCCEVKCETCINIVEKHYCK